MRYLAIIFSATLLFAGWPIQASGGQNGAAVQSETWLEEPDQAETEPVSEDEADASTEADERRRVRRLGDVLSDSGSDEWSMDIPSLDLPTAPAESGPDMSLPNPARDARLQELLRARIFSPDDPDVLTALNQLLDEVEADVHAALEADDVATAGRLVIVLEQLAPERAIVAEAREEMQRRQGIAETLARAEEALEAGWLVNPPGQNAAELYAAVQAIDPDNEAAREGLVRTRELLLAEALERADESDFEGAEQVLATAAGIDETPEAIAQVRARIVQARDQYIENLDHQVRIDIDEGRFEQADDGITQLVALGHDRERIDVLRNSLEDAELYGSFEPGQVFNDALSRLNRLGPDMVVIPAGSFMMGSPDDEPDRLRNEGPRFRVTFERGFAMARTEITVDQFSVFIADSGYQTDAERAGASRVYDLNTGRMVRRRNINWRHDYTGRAADEDLPVIHVSFNDAEAYARWLAEQTGRNYRLPSEAEFEYALRAGSQTRYWWGDGSPDRPVENVTGDGDSSSTGARWNVAFRRYSDGFWGPAPVASLEPNPFGLYDMGGNVMEWVEDCWHDSFVRAPSDGSAWVNPGCDRRVIRGGSWSSTPAMSRSAFRISSTPSSTDMRVGFRVARDL